MGNYLSRVMQKGAAIGQAIRLVQDNWQNVFTGLGTSRDKTQFGRFVHTLDSAGAMLLIGDQTGSPVARLRKSVGGTSQFIFESGGASSWRLTHTASDQWVLAKLAGVSVLTVNQSTSFAEWAAS